MPQTVNRETLLRCANIVKAALSSQGYIPALSHICFDGVTMTAYNDISAIIVRSPVELEMCLPGDLLIRSLSSMSAEEVLLQKDKSGDVVLSSGRSKVKLPALPLEEFPLEELNPKPSIHLTESIIKGIEMCLFSVGKDPTHPAQMGVTLESSKGKATLFSTDNFTISRYTTDSKIKLPADVPVILPTFFCEQIVALSKEYPGDEVMLEVDAGSLTATIGEEATVFTKQLVDLEPMNFHKVMSNYNIDPSALAELVVEIPDSFDSSFARALMILADEMDKITKVSIARGKMNLLSTSKLGEASDSVPYADSDAPTEPFYVDPVLVSRASKVCSHMSLMNTVMVMSNKDCSFLHMISHCSI